MITEEGYFPEEVLRKVFPERYADPEKEPWYEAENTEEGIRQVYDIVCGLHDHRLERAEFVPSKDMLELEFAYDNGEHSFVFRFVGLWDARIDVKVDCEADWYYDCTLISVDRDRIFFSGIERLSREDVQDLDSLEGTWVMSRRLYWAYKDKDGKITAVPKRFIRGRGTVYNHETHRYEEIYYDYGSLEPYDGAW